MSQLSAYQDLEQQRMQNAALAKTLEIYAAARPPAARDAIRGRAVSAWADDGKPNEELRVLRSMNLGTDQYAVLRERYFQLLLRTDQASLLDQASSPNPAYADAAANYILGHAAEPFAQSAIDVRARGRQSVWASTTRALVGLYFADSSPKVDGAFRAALGDNSIAALLAAPPDRSHQVVGEPWFYYGMRYGVYRTLAATPSDDPEDYLTSGLEGHPTAPNSYTALAHAYADANRPDDAAREYGHALELSPRSPFIHRAIATTYWPISKSPSKRQEALDQWNAALALLRDQVDLRVVPESFWIDFAAIARDAHDRNLGPQFRPAMDVVLRAYVAKNGSYRSSELLRSAYVTLSPAGADAAVAWILSLADAARDPGSLLEQLASPYDGGWFPRVGLGQLYRRQLELAQRRAAEQSPQMEPSDFNNELTRAHLRLLTYLIQQRQDVEAQSLFDTIPAAERQQDPVQQARILLAAHHSGIPALLADFTTRPSTAPSLQLVAAAANQLRTAGDKLSNRLLLEYVFQQKLHAHEATPSDYLALAQARLDLKDNSAALELLHRLILLPSASNNTDLYANLDSAAALLERSGHPTEALPFLTTLATATPWNSGYRLRLAQAQIAAHPDAHQDAAASLTTLASSAAAPYLIRSQAAAALKPVAGSHTFDSAELTLLAATTIAPKQADYPYFVPARVRAADMVSASEGVALLRGAMATKPSDSLRLAIFRREFAAGHPEEALAAIKPLLQSPDGYAHLQGQDDMEQANQAQGWLPGNQDAAAESDSFRSLKESSAPEGGDNSATLPILLRTREEQVVFALAVATLYEKIDDPAQAARYLRSAATLNRDSARGKQITERLATTEDRIRREMEDRSRRPTIQPDLNQAVVVRPRLTDSQKVQP